MDALINKWRAVGIVHGYSPKLGTTHHASTISYDVGMSSIAVIIGSKKDIISREYHGDILGILLWI